MKIDWTSGECDECGDEMKVVAMSHFTNKCKQCELLEKFERIAYVLEAWEGDR